MVHLVTTLWSYFTGFIITLFFLPICYVLSLFPYHFHAINRLYFFCTYWWNTLLLKTSFISFTINGTENIPSYPSQPSLFIMNHTSAVDIPLGEYIVGSYPHIWVSKKTYGKIPFFGRLLHRMHVLVDKENNKESARALVNLLAKAKVGHRHVLLFPEGTRSRSGELLPFQPGFAFIAKKLNFPIIPVYIKNAANIMHPNSWTITPHKGHITITIGNPIALQKEESSEDFIVRVRNWFETQSQ